MFKKVFSINIIIAGWWTLIFNLAYSLDRLRFDNDHFNSSLTISQMFNRIFSILKLSDIDQSSRLKVLYHYLISQDLNNFHFIKVKENYNDSDILEIINGIFEENVTHNEVDSEVDDEYIVKYIDTFLSNLQDFKEDFNTHADNLDVNRAVVNEMFRNNDKFKVHQDKNVYNESISNENDVSNENEFWEPSGRRIFKGERSKIKHFPFMASIQIFNNFHCAGSIIKSDLIITASSCLQLAWNNRFFRENPAFLSARVGSSFYNGGGEVIPVLEIYFHPEYDPKSLKNNICLLRLIRHLKFKRRRRNIKRIDIDRSEHNLAYNTPGITVVGWGAKSHSPFIKNPWENKISYAVLDVYPLDDCRETYSKEYVTKKQFCAGFISRGGGACNRDVGGPGISDGKLVGVISFGSPVCGMPDAPTVFTKVGYYADWIEQIMEQDVPVSKKRTTLLPIKEQRQLYLSTPISKPTTFKVSPITDKTMTPIPIAKIDSQLRNINESVFKDFLETMFTSKDVEEYKDLIQDIVKKPDIIEHNKKATQSNVVTHLNQFHVTLGADIFTEFVDNSQKYKGIETPKSTALYDGFHENEPVTDAVDNVIEKLISKVDLEKIVEEEIFKPGDISAGMNPNNESVLTSFYLSDEEKENVKPKSKERTNNDENDSEGMSIAIDGRFKDLTKAKNDNELPESELYGLLSEVIGEEMAKINIDAL